MNPSSLVLAALCSFAGVATAQFIPGVVATTSMGTWSTYNIVNLTNGVGLSAPDITATHSNVWQEMWMSNNVQTGSIEFDLGTVQPLNLIAVWNYNSSISTGRGVAAMDVSLSLDAVNWTPLSSELVPQGTTQPIAAHLIGVGGTPARYVKFDILSNHGNTYTGLSEVQFVAGAGGVVGTNTTLGQGCIRRASSFYERFATPAAFDLANTAITMLPSAGGYLVLPGTAPFVPPTASATTLALANNGQVAVALAAPFSYPGGATTSLQVCANGFVAVAAGNGTGATPTAATMLNAPQTGWWAWHDYNPAAVGSGAVKFEQSGGVAYLTWDGVYDNGGTSPASASTFQFQFDTTTGNVHLVFQTMSALGNAYLVGYSPGGSSIDPGGIDLSAAVPATFTLGTSDVLPLTLAGGSRPVIGNPWTLNVTNVPATATLGIEVFGALDPNLPDLGFLGAPGCGARASLDILNVWIVTGSAHSYSLALPNDPTLVNLHIFTQAVALQPGVNALLGGAITSNGIDGRIGNL